MEIIGQKVRSKASGAVGEIRGIEGNKVLVNFISNSVFPVDIDLLDMPDELKEAISEQLSSRQVTVKTGNTKTREPRDVEISVELVNTRNNILENIHVIDDYNKSRKEPEYSFAIDLIKGNMFCSC